MEIVPLYVTYPNWSLYFVFTRKRTSDFLVIWGNDSLTDRTISFGSGHSEKDRTRRHLFDLHQYSYWCYYGYKSTQPCPDLEFIDPVLLTFCLFSIIFILN